MWVVSLVSVGVGVHCFADTVSEKCIFLFQPGAGVVHIYGLLRRGALGFSFDVSEFFEDFENVGKT